MASFYRNALIDGDEVQLKMVAQRDNSWGDHRLVFTCDVIGLTFDQCRAVSDQTRKLVVALAESLAKDLQ